MTTGGTEAGTRVADVLLQFLEGPQSLGVTSIARQLDLSKAVVHRILQSMVSRGLLKSDPTNGTYRLGPAAAALGARALRGSELRVVAMPELRTLRALTDETTTVSARMTDRRVYLDQVVSNREIKMTVELGRSFPLHAGSSGRAILAFLPHDEQEKILAEPLEALTPATVVDPDRLRALLEEVRHTGVAMSGGERQAAAASLAAPTFDLDGHVTGALSVCGPVSRFTSEVRDALAPLVARSADTVSRSLGWAGGLPT